MHNRNTNIETQTKRNEREKLKLFRLKKADKNLACLLYYQAGIL